MTQLIRLFLILAPNVEYFHFDFYGHRIWACHYNFYYEFIYFNENPSFLCCQRSVIKYTSPDSGSVEKLKEMHCDLMMKIELYS